MSKRPAKKSSEAASSEGKASDQARDKAVEAVLLFLKTTAPYEAASPRSKRELTVSRAIHSCLRLAIHTPASPQALLHGCCSWFFKEEMNGAQAVYCATKLLTKLFQRDFPQTPAPPAAAGQRNCVREE